MADDTFEYITTDFMVSIDSGTPSVQPVEYIIELGEQGIPGIQGEQGEPGYSPVVNYTWDNDTIQFTLVNRDYTETTPNLYDYVLKRDGSNANNPITLDGHTFTSLYGGLNTTLTMTGSPAYIEAPIIVLRSTDTGKVYYRRANANNELATVGDIGNGTITLTQGGVTKGTFTTNQSGNTTIDLDAGGGSISNPLNIGYTNQGVARTLNLGIDTSNNKIISSYMEVTGGSFFKAPVYFLEHVASPLVGSVNSIGAIDLSINTMVGTDGTTNGIAGTVPAPLTTDARKYLRADGTWATPSDYTELTNKPQINSITLTGNKTSSDLGLQNELTQGTGISIVNDTISIDNTVALKTDIPSLTGYATQQWVTNQGYLTSVSSSDVVTALGYTPYSASNPNGYTNNIGTVTSVNSEQPDSNGNVSISIPDVSNFVTNSSLSTTLQDYVLSTDLTTTLLNYQSLLVSGTNIKTINNQSLLGSGNITIQGGSAYTAGTGIDITNDIISIDNTVVALQSDIPTNYVTTNTTQTITGSKTFTQQLRVNSSNGILNYGAYQGLVRRDPNVSSVYTEPLLIVDNSDKNVTVGTQYTTLNLRGSSTRPTYNSNELALLSDISSGGGAVDSVNGQTGDVVLTASDIGALPDTTVIPTKTSDLTNDSGFITSSDIPTNYVTTNTTQSISGIKTFTNAIHTNLIQNTSGNANLFVYNNSSFSIGTTNTRLFLYGNTVRPTYYYNGNTELALLSDIPTVPTTDQTYNSSSTNPQSGTAVAKAISTKADNSTVNNHIKNISNPHKVTASQVGLGNVNNTSDLNKPISTATRTALNNKANIDLSNITSTGIETLLSTIYPVGAVYISTTSTCPLASLMPNATWTKKAEDRVLQGSSSTHIEGTTIAAGLPNITGSFGYNVLSDGSIGPTNTSAIYTAGEYSTGGGGSTFRGRG